MSSPFQRCVATASAVAAAAGLSGIGLEPGLCETLFRFPPGYRSPEDLQVPLIPTAGSDQLGRLVCRRSSPWWTWPTRPW